MTEYLWAERTDPQTAVLKVAQKAEHWAVQLAELTAENLVARRAGSKAARKAEQ